MEQETMVNENGETGFARSNRRYSKKSTNIFKSKWIRAVIGLLATASISILVAFAIIKLVPNNNTSDNISKTVKENPVLQIKKNSEQDFESYDDNANGLNKQDTFDTSSNITERKKSKSSKNIKAKQGHFYGLNNDINPALKRSRCALCLNKIGLIEMDGDYSTHIKDDIRIYVDNQYHSITVYEDSTHHLHLQFDCGGHLGGDVYDQPCSRSLSAYLWIDYNDNNYDDRETQMLRRSWSDNDPSTGSYDLQVYIPSIDNQNVKSGIHKMRLTIKASEEFVRECGPVDYTEIKDYTLNLIPKARPIIITTTPYVYRNPLCSINFGKIILVLMAGETGTEIRDDKIKDAVANPNQNQHHLAVAVYDHTIYLLRVQLDCSWQYRTELTSTGCNLAQNVNVWIDLNDDGQFDSSEMGVPYPWPITSYLPQGIYDLQINIPSINEVFLKHGLHKMRIVVTPSEYYRQQCGYDEYSETRDYFINIVPKSYLPPLDPSNRFLQPSDIECSPYVGKIVFVAMPGEHRTQIREDESTKAVLGNDNRNQQYLSIILYENTKYLLRLQFDCDGLPNKDTNTRNCNLPHEINVYIDLNDDGRFDENESATPYRWPLTSYLPEGIYDLQIYVPVIDGRIIKSGPHKMRLTARLSEQHRQKCRHPDYQDIRDYTITIVSRTRQSEEIGGPYLTLSDRVCTQTNARIVLVIMAGEMGTEIRDDTPLNTRISESQNRHHMGVSLYENTNYRIRIQLDCEPISSRGPLRSDCNLAQDVNVIIDLNNDGRFDDSETRVPSRWPLRSSIPLGIYDYEIFIPPIDGRSIRTGSYNMRVVVQPSDEYTRKCGRSDFSETREYTIQVVSKSNYGY